jgi:methylmalonyl-CoA mutase
VEWLTDQIAQKAWALFQDVEGKGGALKALQSGFIQSEIEKVSKAKDAAMAVRKDVQVGVNQYANLGEKKIEGRQPDYAAIYKSRVAAVGEFRTAYDDVKHSKVISKLSDLLGSGDEKLVSAAVEAVQAGATLGEITRVIRAGDAERPSITPLKLHRLSEPFEALRGAADKFLAKTGWRPRAFLATMGPVSQHKGRGDFSRGFFEVGGFEVVYPNGFDTAKAAVDAAVESGTKVVVICSTDDTYPELVPQLVPALKAAIPGVQVVLAGYPADQIEAHKASGVDEFIHVRANLLQVLGGLQKKIGVQA